MIAPLKPLQPTLAAANEGAARPVGEPRDATRKRWRGAFPLATATTRTKQRRTALPKTSPKKKTFTFGTCNFGRVSPPAEKLTGSTKALNVFVSFEDALKLHLAVSEALRELNSYNRATTAGKKAAMTLTLYLDKRRITVNQGNL